MTFERRMLHSTFALSVLAVFDVLMFCVTILLERRAGR
jgi:hypothetical protein